MEKDLDLEKRPLRSVDGAGDDPDGNIREKARRILAEQLDLETLYKVREVKVIEEEMRRGEELKELVEKLIMNEYVYGLGGSASSGGEASFNTGDQQHYSFSFPGTPIGESVEEYNTISPSPMSGRRSARPSFGSSGHLRDNRPQTEPQAQFEMRPDGTVVRMKCPKCAADKFRSMLGFLNHCRIHCRLVFSSQDDRLQRCGVPVEDASEIPLDYFTKHPSQLKQEMDLALIRADVLGPINDLSTKPSIKVVDDGSFISNSSLPGSAASETDHNINISKNMSNLGSRFYIKRKVIIGNAAKLLTGKKGQEKFKDKDRDNDKDKDKDKDKDSSSFTSPINNNNPKATHKWKLYIRSPKVINDPTHDLKSYIKGFRVFLHPSYRPDDVIDVVDESFEIQRTGWGEFPVKIQIYFWDTRNRPLEIVHFIRMLTATSGKYMVLAEQAFTLELDRKTVFRINFNQDTSTPLVTLPQTLQSNTSTLASNLDLLQMVIDDFPLAGKKGHRAINNPTIYSPTKTIEEFLRLDLATQRDRELQRAAAICNYLMATFPSSFTMTSEEVITWCREHNYTPASVASLVSAYEQVGAGSPDSFLYCRFCGLAHLPQNKFEILQKNCSHRPRKIHLSSKTSANQMLAHFKLLPEGSDVVKRLKQEHLGNPYSNYLSPRKIQSPESKFSSKDGVIKQWIWSNCVDIDSSFNVVLPPESPAIDTLMFSLKVFLKNLLEKAVKEIPESKERSVTRPVLLTPLQLYKAISEHAGFDFLSNAYMLGGAKETKID